MEIGSCSYSADTVQYAKDKPFYALAGSGGLPDNVTIVGTLDVDGDTNLNGTYVAGSLTVEQNVSINERLFVSGGGGGVTPAATISGNMSVLGRTTTGSIISQSTVSAASGAVVLNIFGGKPGIDLSANGQTVTILYDNAADYLTLGQNVTGGPDADIRVPGGLLVDHDISAIGTITGSKFINRSASTDYIFNQLPGDVQHFAIYPASQQLDSIPIPIPFFFTNYTLWQIEILQASFYSGSAANSVVSLWLSSSADNTEYASDLVNLTPYGGTLAKEVGFNFTNGQNGIDPRFWIPAQVLRVPVDNQVFLYGSADNGTSYVENLTIRFTPIL